MADAVDEGLGLGGDSYKAVCDIYLRKDAVKTV